MGTSFANFGLPNDAVHCLPEGKRMLSFSFDYPALSRNGTFGPGVFVKPYFNGSSPNMGTNFNYQQVNISQQAQSQGLSLVRSIIYTWRPTYTKNGDYDLTLNQVHNGSNECIVANVSTGQAIHITYNNHYAAKADFSAPPLTPTDLVVSGAEPFFCDANSLIDVLCMNSLGGAPFMAGKLTFLLCNFDVPPYCKTTADQWLPL